MALAVDDGQVERQLQMLMEAIYLRYGYDFRDYAAASQRRRVQHAVKRFGCSSIPALQGIVINDASVFHQLLQVLTIPVSELFRDPGFFAALRLQVLPVLATYPSLKIWIAGCSTGEEAYSIAILLKEEGLLERSMIYATDINPDVLATARKGVFSLEKIPEYAHAYRQATGRQNLHDHYTLAAGVPQFDRSLCEHITFADHSLATDNVFSEMQLVCCRNVLIYFNARLQDRALGLFHESLCHRGFFGLGHRENMNATSNTARYEAVNRDEKIYRKLQNA